jgi:ankyrin repeat protein
VGNMQVEQIERLVTAAGALDEVGVERLLDAGVPVDGVGIQGRRALDVVLTERSEDGPLLPTVRRLLQAGADPASTVGAYGETTPVFLSVARESSELLKLLLAFDAPANGLDKLNHSPLTRALGQGSREMAEILLQFGAETERHVGGEESPLEAAAASGRPDLVQLILDAGARPETSALRAARIGAERPTLADSTSGHIDFSQVVTLLEDRLGFTGHSGPERIAAAAGEGDWLTVRNLLREGVSADARERHDRTALDLAICAHRDHGGRLEAIESLLAAGANPDQPVGEPPIDLPVSLAARHQLPGLLKLLLDAGADPNQSPGERPSPLSEAARWPTSDGVRLLLAAGAHVDPQAGYHHQPLRDAAMAGRSENVQLLLEAGVEPQFNLLLDVMRGEELRAASEHSPVRLARFGPDPDFRARYAATLAALEAAVLPYASSS